MPAMAVAQTTPTLTSATPVALHFNIPAGALAPALNRFAETTGIQLVYPSALVQGLSTPGLNGDFTPLEALQRLAAGAGLKARMLGSASATLEPPSVGGARTLGAVQVEGVQAQGFVPANGFGAGAGANGSSDPTATEGTGSFTTNGATVASKTPQALKDTPQSVTVITQERIQQQVMTDLTSALAYTPGVTLNDLGAFGSGYVSRGFAMTAFQIDGGAPLAFAYNGDTTSPNLTEYDNIQVLRGSDALFGGAGEPGGVVSLARKRPLDHEQFVGDVDAGSWNNYKIQADVTGPIGFDGHLRARLAISYQDRDFFYDLAHQNKAFVYGVVEGDIGPNTLVRAGFSYEHQDNTGYALYGLPRYSDGGDLHLPRSTNISAPWDSFPSNTPEFFAAMEHRFNSDWGLKLNFMRRSQKSLQEYAQTIGSVDRNIAANSTYFVESFQHNKYKTVQYAVDATVNGAFKMFDLDQTLTAGVDYSLNDGSLVSNATSFRTFEPIPIDIFTFDPDSLNPKPVNLPLSQTVPVGRQEQWGGYATLNLQPIKDLHLIGGIRVSSYWNSGVTNIYNGGSPPRLLISFPSKNGDSVVLTPYAAATYGLTPEISLYASYADIFQAQGDHLDPSGRPLTAITGVTYEAGVKGAFDGGKLNASLSIYYTDESNQAVRYAGACLVGFSCYTNGGVVISQGVDLELSGEILPGWQVQAGYTYNENRENLAFNTANGNGFNSVFQTQQPKHQVKIWTSYNPSGRFDRWTVGGGLRLESSRSTVGSLCSVQLDPLTGACPSDIEVPFAFTQGLYAVVDLRVGYKINDHWQAALNLTNIGDTRYYTTVGDPNGFNFYGEPRAFMFSMRATY